MADPKHQTANVPEISNSKLGLFWSFYLLISTDPNEAF